MPQKERLRVWRGELKKTSGGLTKESLTKNKRGKVVSKKKSIQAVGDANNLGSWLRGKGDRFKGKPKGFKEPEQVDDRDDEKLAEAPKPKKAKPKPSARPKKVVPKPKKVVPKKKKVVKPVVDLTDSPVKAAPKPKKKKKLEPTVPGEVKEPHKVSIGNIIVKSAETKKASDDKVRKQMKKAGFSDKEIDDLMSGGGLPNAAKVRRMLKASKRRGKRRTKKQLLQDVLDL